MKFFDFLKSLLILVLIAVMMVVWTFAGRLVSAPNTPAVALGFGLYLVLLGLLYCTVNFGARLGTKIYRELTDEKT